MARYAMAISDGLGIPLDDLKDQQESTKNLPKFQPIVKTQISKCQAPEDIVNET